MNSQIKNLITELKKITGVSFVAFNYKDAKGEITKRLVNIGVSYKNSLAKDLMMLSNLRFDDIIKEQARVELLKSVILSLKKEEEIEESLNSAIEQIIAENSLTFTEKEKGSHAIKSEAQSETYITICNGLKYHAEKQKLYIQGMSVKKTVVEAVEKADTRKPLTKAKDSIRKDMKSTKYRLFIVDSLESNFKINGDTLELS